MNPKTGIPTLKLIKIKFRTNSTLTELRIANQRAKLATKAEESLMNVMEANNSIRKLGYAFSVGSYFRYIFQTSANSNRT